MDAAGDYPDNAARFTLLGRAALEAIRAEARPVDIIHGHDWEAGPALLSLRASATRASRCWRGPATMLTCHNLAYHGWTPRAEALAARPARLDRRRLGRRPSARGDRERGHRQHGQPHVRSGIADARVRRSASTMRCAPRAIATSASSTASTRDLWDPATDAVLAAPYSAADLARQGSLPRWSSWRATASTRMARLLGVVGRLDPQKGFDLVAAAAPRARRAGRPAHRAGHRRPSSSWPDSSGSPRPHPDRIVVIDRFDRDEARRIYAGADLFLMPSRFEPCGQGQLIAMRYGTPPVVRATGGLADTVIDADAEPAAARASPSGRPSPARSPTRSPRACAAWADRPRFAAIVARGMARDDGWAAPARAYEAAYRRALELAATRSR